MRKNRLIALIGTLTMAAAGLAAVSLCPKENNLTQVNASSTSTENAYSVWLFDQKKNFDHLHVWNLSYSTGYTVDDLVNWFNNFNGPVTTGFSETFSGSASKSGTDIDITCSTYVTGNHYGQDGRHYVIQFPHFVTKMSYGVAFTNGGYTDIKDNSGVLGTKARCADGIWSDSSSSSGTWYLGYDDSYTYPFDKYSVTIHDSVHGNSSKTVYDSEKLLLSDPSDTSEYKFAGWYSNSTYTTSWTSGSIITSDLNLYAKYDAIAADTYTVSFNNGGGTGSMTGYTKNVGESFEVPAPTFTAPSKKKFSHWSGSDGNTYNPGDVTGSSLAKDYALTLTAVWKDYDIIDGYYIEFFDRAQSAADRRIKLDYNGQTGQASQHTKMNVALTAGESFKVVKFVDEAIPSGEYYGTDHADPKAGAATTEGQLYSGSDNNFVVRVAGNYDFYFNDQYTAEAGQNDNKVWIPANSYTVVYDNNGGSGTIGDQTAYFYDDTTVTGRGFAVNVYSKSTFTAPDSSKIFDGWSTNKNATQGELKPGDMQPTAAKVPNPTSGNSVTLYAIWRDKVPADGYYVKIFTDGHQANIPMALKDGSTTEYVVNVDLAENDEFKVVYYQDEVISESTGYHGYTELKSGDGSAKDSNELTGTDNIVASKAGNYEIYYESGSVNHGIWAPNLIDVTFNANGHGTAPQGVTIRNGNAISDPGDLSEEDWTFTGWFEDQACQNEWDFTTNLAFDSNHNANYTVDSANNTCTKTLYAGWEEEITDPTVTVEVNDDNYGSVVDYDGNPVSSFTVPTGSLIEIDDESIIIGEDVYLEAVPADNGAETSYKFVDWTISPSCETVDGDITITANFEEYPTEYKVTLSYNSEYGSVAKTGSGDLDKVPYGTVISVDTENSNVLHVGNNITLTATPEDEVDEYKYSFTGWTFTSPLSGAQTITANFVRVNKYALLYDLGGGEAIGDYDDDGYYVEGTTITLPTDVEKEGYNFEGFYDNEDFEGTPYESSFVIDEDTYLYAKLTKETYSVSYNKGQYGDGEIASQTKTYDEALTLSSSTFTREGYRQDGWSTSDGGTKVYDLGGSYTNNEAITLYPHWVKQCAVTFASNNNEYGSVSSSGPITVDEGTSVTVNGNSITIGTTTVTATPTTSTDDVEYSFTGWSVSTGSTISSSTEIVASFESELTSLGKAKEYAQAFINKMNDTCDLEEDADGNIIVKTEIAKLQAAWKDEFGAFNELSPGAQNYLTSATPVYDEGSTDVLGKFAASYDYIYGKYHSSLDEIDGVEVGDFAKREPNEFADSRLFSVSEVSTSTWIIASVAIVGIAAVGVFFIYRKRKEN